MNDTKAIQRTPGPWSVDSIDQVHAKDGTVVARCERKERHEYMSCEVQRANARLIAAAPELLIALEFLLNPDNVALTHAQWGDGCNAKEVREAIDKAKQAILKAKGG